MFKTIIQLWQGKGFLTKVLEEFKYMLDEGEEMFGSVCKNLLYHEDVPGLKERLYHLDKKVNDQERDIRKRVVAHLSAQPSVDIPVSLILMSVVKDAERLGDYAKNLFEINALLAKPIDKELYEKLFDKVEVEIQDLFAKTKEAFLESNEEKANETWAMERAIVKKCDETIKKLAGSNISVNEAVCFTLMARHFKRLAAHLTNIATSVVVPISDLDFNTQKKK